MSCCLSRVVLLSGSPQGVWDSWLWDVWLCLLLGCGTAAQGSPTGQEEPDCGNSLEQLLPASPGCHPRGFIALTSGLDTLLQMLQPDRV